MSGGGVRVSIPGNVRKTIQNIKEITGNHSDEEIYAMLKECSMDPNETAQKLLSQDPFHEVRRKRDRKKENMNNRESGDSQWRSTQRWGSRGGRVNFSLRHTSHDTGVGRSSATGRDNGTNHAAEKGAGSSLSASEEKSKETTPSASSAAVMANGPTGVVSGNASATLASNLQPTGSNQHESTLSPVGVNKVGRAVSHIDVDKASTIAFGTGDACRDSVPSSKNPTMSVTPASSSKVCFLSSDPVLMPSNDSLPPGTVGTIKRELGIHQTVGESNAVIPSDKSASEIGVPFMEGKMPGKNQGVGKSQLSGFFQPSSTSIQGGSSISRPNSNYNSRSQQIIGLQKGENFVQGFAINLLTVMF